MNSNSRLPSSISSTSPISPTFKPNLSLSSSKGRQEQHSRRSSHQARTQPYSHSRSRHPRPQRPQRAQRIIHSDSENENDSEDDTLLSQDDIDACDEARTNFADLQRKSAPITRTGRGTSLLTTRPSRRWYNAARNLKDPRPNDDINSTFEADQKRMEEKKRQIANFTGTSDTFDQCLEIARQKLEKERQQKDEQQKKQEEERQKIQDENDGDYFIKQTEPLTEAEKKQCWIKNGIPISTATM